MQRKSSQHFDVLCLGSGISNLVAAILLAKNGLNVLVLEQHYKAGGYLHGFRRFGAHFDTGAHYIGSMYPHQSFRKLLEYLGAYEEKNFTQLDQEGFDEFRFPNFRYSTGHGYEQTIANLVAVFPNERSAIESFFQHIQHVSQLMPLYNLDERMDANLALPYFEKTLAEVVNKIYPSHHLRCALYAYCVLHCVHPEDTPFAYHAVMIDSLIRGAVGLSQGGDGLAQSLVRALQQNGGKLLLKTRVDQLIENGDQINWVQTESGEKFSAQWVISCLHPQSTFALLEGSQLRKSFKDRLHKTAESVGFLGVYGVSRHLNANFTAKKNYFAFNSEDLSGLEILRNPSKLTASSARGLYLVRNDRGFHKSESKPITIHAPAPYDLFKPWAQTKNGARPSAYKDLKKQMGSQLISDAKKMFEDFDLQFEKYEISTPLSNLHYNPSPYGSPYGIYHGSGSTGLRGFGPRTPYSNLILTGQNTMFPGLFASALSGVRSAGHILGITTLLKNIRLSMGSQQNDAPKSGCNRNRNSFVVGEQL